MNVTPAVEFLKALFSATEQPIFLQTLANDPDDPDEGPNKRHLLSRDIAAIERFVAKHNRARRGMFVCVATIAEGSGTRSKDNCREICVLHADLDFKGIAEDEPAIWAAIAKLEAQPSIIVRSGGGLHLYWLLREPLDAQAYRDAVDALLRQIAEIVAGDLAVCEVARLMRLPATHNSKYGDMREVTIERLDAELRYELEGLAEWASYQRPVLTRKVVTPTPKKGGSRPSKTVPENPFLAAAAAMGRQPRLDVEEALAAMGEGNIHDTQVRVSAALLARGETVEDTVSILMEATRQTIGADAAKWNWKAEERRIRVACAGALKKFPPKEAVRDDEPEMVHLNTDNIADLATARARRKPRAKAIPDALITPFIVANGVIDTLRQAGQDIMLAEGDVWLYRDGFWHTMTPTDQQWLLTLIQGGFEVLQEPGKTSALTSSWKRLNEHPNLFRADVPWANGDLIVCRNGVLRIEMAASASSDHFEGHRPDNYARRHIGADFDPEAACPRFEALLLGMLGKAELVDLVQEWLGAALSIGSLSREERRALLLVGPSRTGKTELAKIFAMLLGNPIATPSVADISNDRDRFALSSLYGAVAWIRDDAINEGDKLNPQRFKTIVTGEPIDIQLKHKNIIPNYRFEIPTCLTCNSLPKAIDGSDAIFNRSLVLRMDNVIDEATAARVRADNGVRGSQSIGVAIFEAEASGILNWALAGLLRLRERGFYDIPPSVRDAIGRFKDDNNPIGEWVREAIQTDPYSKVERRDLVRAYNGWQFEQDGEKAEGRGGRWLLPRLRNQVPGLGDAQTHGGFRYVTGVKLTEVGLAMWKTYGDANPHGGAGGCATTAAEVNKTHEKEAFSHASGAASDIPF